MTTLVNTETGEMVEPPSYGAVRQSVDAAKTSLEAAAEQIVWQIERQAWAVLGYANWNEMREAEYGGAAFMVPKAERPELVARMRRSGLTHADIAETAGVAEATVRSDLNRRTAVETEPAAPIINARGQQRPSSYATRPPAPTAPQQSAVDRAVAEFPDLSFYVEIGESRDAVSMADDLRRFRDRGQLDERLDNLRRSIAVRRAKRDGTDRPNTTAVMNDAGEYEMQPLPQPPAPKVCPACGQNVRA